MKKFFFAAVFLVLLTLTACQPKGEVKEEDHEHVWSEYYTQVAPKEDEDGVRTYTCTLCGETKEIPIPALSEENAYFVVITPSTCEEEGNKLFISEEWGEFEVVTAPIGHDYGSTPTYSTATCLENGEDVYVCKNCGGEKRTERKALGHDLRLTGTYDGNCVEKKNVCNVCGESFETSVVPYEHDYREKERGEGGCREKSYVLYVCSLCGEEKKEEGSYAHAFNKDTGKCDVCGEACVHIFSDYVCTICGFSVWEELSDRSGLYVGEEGVYLGFYPQSAVGDEELCKRLDEVFSDGEKEHVFGGFTYTAVDLMSVAERGRLFFSDGSSVSPLARGRNVCYFRHEPILWRAEKNGVWVADVILDVGVYQAQEAISGSGNVYYCDEENGLYANNWSQSAVRNWLSTSFFNAAFNEKQKTLLLRKENDNAESGYYPTDGTKPWLEQEETTDVVFLPAFSDLFDPNEAADKASESRVRKLSDYALCRGGKIDDKISNRTKWFLRSSGLYSAQVCAICADGSLTAAAQVYENYGFAPAIGIAGLPDGE